MQDLLDEFDPLSINSSTLTANPSARPTPSASTTRSSPHTAPLFETTTSRIPPTSTRPSQPAPRPAVFPAPTDPLDALAASLQPPSPNRSKSDELLLEAQRRSQCRQNALAQHLAHEPFKPLITLGDLDAASFASSASTTASQATISIPTAFFTHKPSKTRTPSPRTPPALSSPSLAPPKPHSPLSRIDKEKLAAALCEELERAPVKTKPLEREFAVLNTGAHRSISPGFDGPEGRPAPISLCGLDGKAEAVMDDELAEGIRLHLPPRLKIPARWELVYSIDQHGTSLATLYQRSLASRAGCVIVVRDERGQRFGAFVNEPLRVSKEYYGSGECFLWRAVQFGPGDFRIGVSVRTYGWTGANDYMVLSDQELLSVGGGDGKFGLWIDANLHKGVSARCPAFGNEVLCCGEDGSRKEEGSFEILGFECWRIAD